MDGASSDTAPASTATSAFSLGVGEVDPQHRDGDRAAGVSPNLYDLVGIDAFGISNYDLIHILERAMHFYPHDQIRRRELVHNLVILHQMFTDASVL